MKKMNQDRYNNIEKELEGLFNQRKKKKVLNILFQVRRESLNSNGEIKLEDFYKLIGALLNANSDFFMNKFYKNFNTRMSYNLSMEELVEMEKYILEKYSFFNEEKLLKWFKGRIIQRDTQVTGRVYITNYRIIALGKFGPTTMSSIGAAGAATGTNMGSSQVGANIAINSGIQKYLQKRLQRTMSQISESPKPCFGYQYPIRDAYNIYQTKKLVKYWVKIEYQKGMKMKTKVLKMKVIPKKMYLESKSNFNNRKKEILSLMMQQLKTIE